MGRQYRVRRERVIAIAGRTSRAVVRNARHSARAMCVVVPLCVASLRFAAAQDTADTARAIRDNSAPVYSLCIPRATRATAACDAREVVVRADKKLNVSVDLPAEHAEHCAAALDLEYTQRNTFATVWGTIRNADCAASKGEYQLAVRIRDERLDVKTLEFVEAWQRQDDQPVKFMADYSIGRNADLLGVHAHSLRCTCIDSSAQRGKLIGTQTPRKPETRHTTEPRP